MSFYDITDTDEKGKVVSISEYVGKVVLIVNVASQCGHTNTHYTQLPKLYDEYHARGFEILAFPCNQFGAQEPGSAEDICSFVDGYDSTMRKKLRFFDKGDVNGKDARPLYKYLKEKAPEEDTGATDIRWNFVKFLIDHDGNPYKRYGPRTPPFSLKDDIEALLQKMDQSR